MGGLYFTDLFTDFHLYKEQRVCSSFLLDVINFDDYNQKVFSVVYQGYLS